MSPTVNLDLRALNSFASATQVLSGPQLTRVLREALSAAGGKTRTQVRRALREQANVKAAKDINDRTRSYLVAGQLAYRIVGERKALPIDRVKGLAVTTGPGGGVLAAPWQVLRQFQRSFIENGKYMARLGPDRFPIRKLYGPSIAKELVKGQSLAAFHAAALPELRTQVISRLARMLPR
jgi:hypothetical protein